MRLDGQLAFDFDEFEREDARNNLDSWQGAPLRFTTDYYAPEELDHAFQHWQFLYGNFGSIRRSHMWHRSFASGGVISFGDHSITTFSADLGPGREQLGPGDLLYQAICEPCGWHDVDDSENTVVEAWHDHAVPGWRELPVIPEQIRVRNEKGLTKLARTWIAERYPKHMQVPGAPIITERARPMTRHVGGYSPWGGYDLSSTALDRPAANTTPPVAPGIQRGTLGPHTVDAPAPTSRTQGEPQHPAALRR